ncbi:hypothetical protein [Inmirania thermothiophila]|uniref:Uncharacterized protein n=1 Tax=Inmirania thermothiophila TaxID=1750597 RepID=A0A3N1Y7S4_9GAMM|nr:hypothetical protein [Inmirania thermothiophila]ROR34886.1 hypothetical protein EDC57_0795 [Inmirania thermothiophila]
MLISPLARLLLAALALALGAWLLAEGSPFGWAGVAACGLFVWGWLRTGAVPLAFRAFQRRDLPAMRRWLAQIVFPGLLGPRNRAYYHWLRAVELAARGERGRARVHAERAAAGRVPSANDRALVHCLAAELAAGEGDAEAVARHLAAAREAGGDEAVRRLVARTAARLGGA